MIAANNYGNDKIAVLISDENRIANVISNIPADCQNLLVVGCTTSALFKKIIQEKPHIHLSAILETKISMSNIHFMEMNLTLNTPWPIKSQSIDTVICINVLHYMASSINFSHEICRITKSGSKIIFSTPKKDTLLFLSMIKKLKNYFKNMLQFIKMLPNLLNINNLKTNN